ncbi:MAG: META domain-containing protein [Chloracidobacterium sp.]|nr:META domain-containing protein [Chloracidobacterium sp.]
MKQIIGMIMVLVAGVVNAAIAGQLPVGNWRLVKYDFGNGFFKPLDSQPITFNVNRNGGVGGNTGCNVYGGDYTYEKGKFRVHDLIQTMMACEDPTPGFEGKYLDVLRSATEFRVRRSTLFVEDKARKRKIEFVRVFDSD